jgi:hypothetical protein
MPRKIRAILGTLIAAIALVALTAVPALAGAVTVNLAISPAAAAYDHDVVITPTIVGTETIPGDAITLETWSSVDATWTLFGEGLKVEDTGTVCPQYISIDDTFLPWYLHGTWTPTNFRATFKPISRGKDASGTAWPASPSVVSNTAALTVIKTRTVRVKTSYPKSIKHGKKYTFRAHTSPNVGVGTIRFTITRHGYRTVTVNARADDSGSAAAVLKFAKKGTYKVTARWLGNAFGAASKAVSTNVKVR